MRNILGAPESLLPVRGLRVRRSSSVPLHTGTSGCSLLRDKQMQPPPSDWFPGITSLGWTHHSTQNTFPFPGRAILAAQGPPQEGPRGLSGQDGTEAERQSKEGGQEPVGMGGEEVWGGEPGLREARVGSRAASHKLEGSSLMRQTSPLSPSPSCSSLSLFPLSLPWPEGNSLDVMRE